MAWLQLRRAGTEPWMWGCCGRPPGLEPGPEPEPGPGPEPEPEPEREPVLGRGRGRRARREAEAEAEAIAAVKAQRQKRRARAEAAAGAADGAAAAAAGRWEASSEGDLPAHWVGFPPEQPDALQCRLALDEAEARGVAAPFEAAGLRPTAVVRAQNRRLWRRFSMERELLSQQHGAGWEPRERHLYHATAEDALSLALGEGLDERFSRGGNLGRAIYCASSPRKAHHYGHGSALSVRGKPTRRQMLVCVVLLGDTLQLGRGETRPDLVREPRKARARRGSCGEYDSVAGTPQPPEYYDEVTQRHFNTLSRETAESAAVLKSKVVGSSLRYIIATACCLNTSSTTTTSGNSPVPKKWRSSFGWRAGEFSRKRR